MHVKSVFNVFLIILILFILIGVGFFYLSPLLSQVKHPAPETPELQAIRESFHDNGYLTEDDVKKLNESGEDQIKQLKQVQPSK